MKETFYPGPSRSHLAAFPPKERWDNWTELDPRAWPQRKERHYSLVPTTCFNCESACGLLAYIDKVTGEVQKFEGNPENPGSRGRNCAKGPATLNQVTDPDRTLYPLKRAGKRAEGKWERVGWEGYQLVMCLVRPSPDHANAKVILLIRAHLESGHYFNPHAQRVIDGKTNGAKLIVFDTRLSNTATHADHFIPPYTSSEAAILLSIANYLIQNDLYNREFVERWWNWQEFLVAEGIVTADFADFEARLKQIYRDYTFEFAAEESGVEAEVIEEIARWV